MEIPSGSGHTPFEAALHYQTLAFMQEVGPRFKPEWLNSDCPGGGRWVVESTGAVSQGPRPIGLAKPVWEEGQVKCFGPQGELTSACQRRLSPASVEQQQLSD